MTLVITPCRFAGLQKTGHLINLTENDVCKILGFPPSITSGDRREWGFMVNGTEACGVWESNAERGVYATSGSDGVMVRLFGDHYRDYPEDQGLSLDEPQAELARVKLELERAKEHIGTAFHPEIGWAVAVETHEALYKKYRELAMIVHQAIHTPFVAAIMPTELVSQLKDNLKGIGIVDKRPLPKDPE